MASEVVFDNFIGNWKLESSENFDEYMKAINVGFMMRKLGSVAKPNVIIAKDGETCVIRSETSFTTNENKFKLNEEFIEETADGRKIKTIIEIKDGKMLHKQDGGDNMVSSTITRELSDDNTMICKCTAKDVTSTRVYKKM